MDRPADTILRLPPRTSRLRPFGLELESSPAALRVVHASSEAIELRRIAERIETQAAETRALQAGVEQRARQAAELGDWAGKLAAETDAGKARHTVIQALESVLAATVLWIDDTLGAHPLPPLAHSGLLGLLADAIAEARRTGDCSIAAISPSALRARGLASVLIGSVPCGEHTPAAVVALRDAAAPAFEPADRGFCRTLLAIGGKVLRSAATEARLEQSAVETVAALATVVDLRDNYTAGHSQRVAHLARLTGQALGLPAKELQRLEWAGLLHDVGKLGVAERILNKGGPLTQIELEQMRQHPRLSYEMLRPVSCLAPLLGGVLHHHENYDGSGYPDGLAGEEIPLAARILRVVDIFDALTSTRPYRPGMSMRRALSELRRGAGTITDRRITRAFLRALRGYLRGAADAGESTGRERRPHTRVESQEARTSSTPVLRIRYGDPR